MINDDIRFAAPQPVTMQEDAEAQQDALVERIVAEVLAQQQTKAQPFSQKELKKYVRKTVRRAVRKEYRKKHMGRMTKMRLCGCITKALHEARGLIAAAATITGLIVGHQVQRRALPAPKRNQPVYYVDYRDIEN
jgi:hypothetical protein